MLLMTDLLIPPFIHAINYFITQVASIALVNMPEV